ncbi:MAG: chorismate synthase [Candidatus Kerfeldbacteria bacterium]|nr:chorismate synthase [Candidatus Kerfeldbacteria bacterium]
MPGNTFGTIFRLTTWGESHGVAIGGVIDGCPADIALCAADIQKDLDRRKPGQSSITSARKEPDTVQILSGVFQGKTTGTPISLIMYNQDQRSKDYEKLVYKYRPGHADEVYDLKYGWRDYRGGGRASARETAIRVAAGAIAKKILPRKTAVIAYTKQIQDLVVTTPKLNQIEQNTVRAADNVIAKKMVALIKTAMRQQDSLGGVIEIVIKHCPIGLGEPVFDKLKADLAKALLSINAVVGFEYGAGFGVAQLYGSEHNKIEVGMYGGISNGKTITMRVAVKPTSSIKIGGRHDPCLLPRAVPICEAMVNVVLADHYLRNATATV